jgi:hypothetical protein
MGCISRKEISLAFIFLANEFDSKSKLERRVLQK